MRCWACSRDPRPSPQRPEHGARRRSNAVACPRRCARLGLVTASFDPGVPAPAAPGSGLAAPDATSAVLRRAVDLSPLVEHDRSDIELGIDHLRDIAAEVGIPASALAQALAEQLAGAPTARGSVLDRLVGPTGLAESRVASGTGAEAHLHARRWLEVGHGLRVRVRDDGVIMASKRTDVVGKVVTGLRRARGREGLGRARSVLAATVEIDDTPVVCVVVDAANKRSEALVVGSTLTGMGMSAVGAAALFTTPVVLVALPVVAGGGLLFCRNRYRSAVVRLAEDLEDTVRAIADGDRPPTLARSVLARLPRSG